MNGETTNPTLRQRFSKLADVVCLNPIANVSAAIIGGGSALAVGFSLLALPLSPASIALFTLAAGAFELSSAFNERRKQLKALGKANPEGEAPAPVNTMRYNQRDYMR